MKDLGQTQSLMFWSTVLCKSNTSLLKNGAAGLTEISGHPPSCAVSQKVREMEAFDLKRKKKTLSIKNAVAITGPFMERPGKR